MSDFLEEKLNELVVRLRNSSDRRRKEADECLTDYLKAYRLGSSATYELVAEELEKILEKGGLELNV